MVVVVVGRVAVLASDLAAEWGAEASNLALGQLEGEERTQALDQAEAEAAWLADRPILPSRDLPNPEMPAASCRLVTKEEVLVEERACVKVQEQEQAAAGVGASLSGLPEVEVVVGVVGRMRQVRMWASCPEEAAAEAAEAVERRWISRGQDQLVHQTLSCLWIVTFLKKLPCLKRRKTTTRRRTVHLFQRNLICSRFR